MSHGLFVNVFTSCIKNKIFKLLFCSGEVFIHLFDEDPYPGWPLFGCKLLRIFLFCIKTKSSIAVSMERPMWFQILVLGNS